MKPKTRWAARLGLFCVGLGFLGTGLGYLLRGQAFYQTYWGGAAFAPLLVIVGAFVIWLAIFRKDDELAQKKRRR